MHRFDSQWLIYMLISAPGLILSLTIHELAHARTALAFGDPTARDQGRISLNPLRHLDPLGTLALFFVGFGWAKPVPVNPNNLHPPRLGNFAVSIAGPLSNLMLAVVFGLLLRVLIYARGHLEYGVYETIRMVLAMTTLINITLFLFNLIPLAPLDGHHILGEMLPPRAHWNYVDWQARYGRSVLMAVIFLPWILQILRVPSLPGTAGEILSSPIRFVQAQGYHLLARLLGLPPV